VSFRLFKPVSRFDRNRGFTPGISPFSKPQTTERNTHETTTPPNTEGDMPMTFAPARKNAVSLKLAITGPSGSGKTTAALRVARGLVGPHGRIGLIDTEQHSASLYADRHTFDALNLDPPFDPSTFAGAVKAAQEAKFDVLIVDTLSHAWEAVLEYKDALDRRGGNSFTNWNQAGAKWHEVVRAMLSSRQHVIACIRSKTEYVLELNEKGKSVPKKIGMAPIARDGTEYEFTLVWDLDLAHQATASKDRTRLFDGKIQTLSEADGKALAEWLTTDDAQPTVESGPPTAAGPEPEPEPEDARETPPAPREMPAEIPTPLGSEAKVGAVSTLLPTWFTAHELEAKVGAVSTLLPPWFAANEAVVNAYLVRVNWIAAGQTWRDLTAERCVSIVGRKDRFARAAGIPHIGGAS
jgi:DNA polymerase III delta prime subunit